MIADAKRHYVLDFSVVFFPYLVLCAVLVAVWFNAPKRRQHGKHVFLLSAYGASEFIRCKANRHSFVQTGEDFLYADFVRDVGFEQYAAGLAVWNRDGFSGQPFGFCLKLFCGNVVCFNDSAYRVFLLVVMQKNWFAVWLCECSDLLLHLVSSVQPHVYWYIAVCLNYPDLELFWHF